MLLHLACVFLFSLSLGKPNCSLGGLPQCKRTLLYFMGGYYLFLVWGFGYCCLFLWCEQAVIPQDAQCVLREQEAMGRASSQCLVVGLAISSKDLQEGGTGYSYLHGPGSGYKLKAELQGYQSTWQ